jgi:hypothetical protein
VRELPFAASTSIMSIQFPREMVAASRSSFAEPIGQLGDVGRYAPGLIFGHEVGPVRRPGIDRSVPSPLALSPEPRPARTGAFLS